MELGAFEHLCRILSARCSPAHAVGSLTPAAWTAVLALSEQERVSASLHEAVAARFSGIVPKAERAVLATQYEVNRRRNAALRRALLELGEAGASSGFQFAALKGAAWLIEDEDDCAAWREMLDLDVLVHPRHYELMPHFLESMGYVLGTRLKRYQNNFHLAPYSHPTLPAVLEVHRHLGWYHHLLSPEILLASSAPVAPGLLLPAPWARAFHAIVHWQIQDHGAFRGTLPPRHVVEVARFLARPDVDWAKVRAHADAVGAADACEFALASAAILLQAPLPCEITPRRAAQLWVARSMARRASPMRTWLVTQMWRAGTLWRCEKVAYRWALRGSAPAVIVFAVWAARIVRLPLLAVRAATIAVQALARASSARAT
jgi:Uncharacterised nucleotidyltransferase